MRQEVPIVGRSSRLAAAIAATVIFGLFLVPGVQAEPKPRKMVHPTKANPRGYSLTPSEAEPFAACAPKPAGTAVCLSIRPPLGASPNYAGGGESNSGLAAAELRDAYDIPATGGSGQTIAIIDAYGDPHAEEDLAKYREAYGMAPCTTANGCYEQINQLGETEKEAEEKSPGSYPQEGPYGWVLETALDLDMAAAMCPECHLRLVETNGAGSGELYAGEDKAAEIVGKVGATTEISDSWTVSSGGEFPSETSADEHFDHPGIVTTVASGDVSNTFYPAVSPYVVSVGGTVLDEAPETSRGWTEKVWGTSGAGCSQYEPKPSWQTDWGCGNRTDNDVAADAEVGISVYNKGWITSGGTSASAPIVAGIMAHASKAVREEGPEAFYHHQLFDVTSGYNRLCHNTYLCEGREGYDAPTSWGTPDGPLGTAVGLQTVTMEADEIGETGATLHGYVDPEGSEASYYFEYGQTTAYGHTIPGSPVSAGSGRIWRAVNQKLVGLERARTYHYRIVVTQGGKTIYGADRRFSTVTWAYQEAAKPVGSINSSLSGLSCSSSNACIAVGLYHDQEDHQRGLAEGWNGTGWVPQDVPMPAGAKTWKLAAVSCASPVSCTAVGSYSSGSGTASLVERWNGTSWALQTVPSPEGALSGTLTSVSCISASSCIAVGRYKSAKSTLLPLVESWNGSSWSIQATPTPEGATYLELLGISCGSSESCVAVGNLANASGKSAVLRWNGKEWTAQELPNTGTLVGVSCASPSACMAIGSEVTSDRWDGTKWTAETLAEPIPFYENVELDWSRLSGVSCSSVNQCVATGHIEKNNEEIAIAEEWNGVEWELQGAPREFYSALQAVSCPMDTLCIGVGKTRESGSTEEVGMSGTDSLPASSAPAVETVSATNVAASALRLNGTVNPQGLATKYYFEYGSEKGKYEYKTSETNAGFYRTKLEVGEAISGLKPGTTYHYRIVATNAAGTATGEDVAVTTTVWSLQSFPNASGAKWTAPRRVSCVSSTACVAVGDYENGAGARNPLSELWNGTEWAVQSVPSPSGAKWAALAGVSCASATSCSAVGRYENSSGVEVTLAEIWNGSTWTVQSSPNPSGAKSSWLEGISCSSSSACTAIGRYMNSSGVEVTLAERWNGTSWTVQTTSNPSGAKWSRLADISCTSLTACLAVGSYESSGSVRLALAEIWNGTSWAIQATPGPNGSEWNSLKGVWCGSSTECTAVGGYRISGEYVTLVERLNGSVWSVQATPEPKRGSLLDVSCASSSWCEASGTNEGKEPLAEHWNGSEWTIESSSIPVGVSVSALEGISCVVTCIAVGYTGTSSPSPLAESYPLRPPYAKTEPATGRGATKATLHGVVNPGGAEANYYFEYGPTTAYGSKTGEVSAGSGMSNVEESQPITSLTAKSSYHFRIVASSGAGISYGQDQAFTTLAALNPNWRIEGSTLEALEAEEPYESHGTFKLTGKAIGNEVAIECAERGSGTLGVHETMSLSACKTKLNGTESAACAGKGAAPVELDKEFHLAAGTTRLVTISTSSSCAIGETIPIIVENGLAMQAGPEAVNFAASLPAAPPAYLLSKTEEHKSQVSITSTWTLTGKNKGKKFAYAEPKSLNTHWRIEGSTLEALGAWEPYESHGTFKLTGKALGKEVAIECTESGSGTLGLQETMNLSACKTKLNGTESAACAGKGSAPVELDKEFHLAAGTTRLVVLETSSSCAIGETIPVIVENGLTMQTGAEAVNFAASLPAAPPAYLLSKTEEHKSQVSITSTWTLTGKYKGKKFGYQ